MMETGTYLSRLDEHAQELLQKWNLQGFSIGVVKNGEVLAAKGYGKKNAEEAVDAETMMPIGSATKSFTSLLLGMLVEEGKVTWDTPVIQYLPQLKLYDPYVTNHVTLRDLLSHRTGIAAYDAQSIYPVPENRMDMIPQLEYLEPQFDFRAGFKYSNQMVMLAGCVAEAVTGKTWEELVTERILKPLGMDHTVMSVTQMEENRSLGYIFNGQENAPQPYLDLKGVGPAGAICSTVGDMMKYMQFHLSDGTWNGVKLVEKATLDEVHKPQFLGSPYLFALPEITETTYGLGWFTDLYREKRMWSHGGNTLGFSALMTLLPCEDLGIIVLANGTTNFLPQAVTYEIMDDFLGVPAEDWTDKLNAVLGPLFAGMATGAQAKEAARVKDTTPSLPLSEYAGTYAAPGFMTITIAEKDGGLFLNWNGYDGILMHYNYDVFDAAMFVYGVVFPCTFKIEDGKVTGFEAVIEPMPGISPVCFKKQ